MSTFKITDTDPITGIVTTVHHTGDKVAIQKTYDAQPFLEGAHAMREATAGERWGEMRHVGFIPMAQMATFYRQDGGFDRARCMAWLKANPAFVTFNKALK